MQSFLNTEWRFFIYLVIQQKSTASKEVMRQKTNHPYPIHDSLVLVKGDSIMSENKKEVNQEKPRVGVFVCR